MGKILLVDDDDELLAVISESLIKDGHKTELCYSKAEALEMLAGNAFDLLVFDVTLPDGSGFDLCQQYRTSGGTTPILMLTGKSDERDKEFGLDSGADDYLTKPFGLRELGARIRALLRRPAAITPEIMQVNELKIDVQNRKVFKNDQEVRLQPLDYSLLEFLIKNPNQVFSQETILSRIWTSYTESGVEALRAAVKRIRKEIDQDGADSFIETIHKVGYAFRPRL